VWPVNAIPRHLILEKRFCGYYAFTLGSDRYPAALTIRGTIEFDTPAGAQIGALGIRIPNSAAHTYTTLPALAK